MCCFVIYSTQTNSNFCYRVGFLIVLKAFSVDTSIAYGQSVIVFVSGSGEGVTVTVCAKEEDTAALLAKVLDGDLTAASLLTKAIHHKLQLRDEKAESLQLSLSSDDVAIWIDPIGNIPDFLNCTSVQHVHMCTTFWKNRNISCAWQ